MFINHKPPAQVEMESLGKHEYRQRKLKKGEIFEADAEHVLLLETLERAKVVEKQDADATDSTDADDTKKPDPEKKSKKNRNVH